MALSQRELNGMTCAMPHEHAADTCEGGPLYLHGACHIGSPTWAVYDHGLLTITCAECKREIATIYVAEEPPDE